MKKYVPVKSRIGKDYPSIEQVLDKKLERKGMQIVEGKTPMQKRITRAVKKKLKGF